MILNGKAKEEFEKWYWNEWFDDKERNYYEEKEIAVKALYTTDTVFLNALIIEFFDSVDIYIYLETATYVLKPNFRYKIITDDDTIIGFKENSRQEATIQAIKKANDLYNNTDKV